VVQFTVFCYILLTIGIVRGNLVYFPVLVFCTKKNLATLVYMQLEVLKSVYAWPARLPRRQGTIMYVSNF
jgi:hypothetical protein